MKFCDLPVGAIFLYEGKQYIKMDNRFLGGAHQNAVNLGDGWPRCIYSDAEIE